MSSSDGSIAASDHVPSTTRTTQQDPEQVDQHSSAMEEQHDVDIGTSRPTAGQSGAQEHEPSERASSQHDATTSSDANDDDGDISLVGSPKIDEGSAATNASFHRRIDSVPPQKYSITHDVSTGPSNGLASTSLHTFSEEEEQEADISATHPQDDIDLDTSSSSATAQHPSGRHHSAEPTSIPNTIDKAELNFVDITLDVPDQQSGGFSDGLRGSGPLAGSARTAEQIRGDSFSSQNPQNTSNPASANQLEHDTPLAADTVLSTHDQTLPQSSVTGDTGGRRSAEGRYAGRKSAPSSRPASPARSPSSRVPDPAPASSSQEHIIASAVGSSSLRDRRAAAPAPVLLAADEDGNISVVAEYPVSPRTVPTSLSQGDEGKSAEATSSASPVPASSAESKHNPSDSKAAASISDEVAAADAAEGSRTSTHSTTATSSLAPPEADSAPTSTTTGLSDKADQVDAKIRRKSSSAGADPVDSLTRMTTLPAKPKTEEIKHRADFERMMMGAKEAERKKRDEEEERKRQRQDEQREALARWEKEILPSWSRARKDPELERLWWRGAPPSIRGRVWALAIGNPLMLPRNLLEQQERKAAGGGKGSMEEVIPRRVLDQIDDDVEDALPSLKLFQEDGPLHEDLVRMCRAFVLVRMEQVAELDVAGDANKAASRHQNASPGSRKMELPSGDNEDASEEPLDEYARRGIDLYQPGLASLAAVLLISMSINTAFIALLNLLHSKPWLKALYSLLPNTLPSDDAPHATNLAPAARKTGSAYTLPPKEKAIRGFERVFETLLADSMPKVFANLLAHNVKLHRVVLRDWVCELWARWLDVDTVMRLWDVVLLDETDGMIYRVCLGLVQMLESRLYGTEGEELVSVLRGEDRAALAVWRREKEVTGELVEMQKRRRSSRRSSSGAARVAVGEVSAADGSALSVASSHSEDAAAAPTRTSSLATPSPPTDTDVNPAEAVTPRDYIYEQYSFREDHVFQTLEAQQSWWKPSTLQRLLDRELSE
ncbi:Rab-GAP TBC domain-containing protein [Pseudozyma hubeiensis]|nr:Rab-GAP TBC domain-containing protein [Pseudozyma hubeiensis]